MIQINLKIKSGAPKKKRKKGGGSFKRIWKSIIYFAVFIASVLLAICCISRISNELSSNAVLIILVSPLWRLYQ